MSCSSAEAEYRALAHTAADLQWTLFLLRELGISPLRPPLLYCDNVSMKYPASNPIIHARTKHIEVHYQYFLRERVLRGDLHIIFVQAWIKLPIFLPKVFGPFHFKLLRDKLMMYPCSPINLKGGVKISELTN